MRNISAKFEVCSGNYHPLSQTLKKKPYFFMHSEIYTIPFFAEYNISKQACSLSLKNPVFFPTLSSHSTYAMEVSEPL